MFIIDDIINGIFGIGNNQMNYRAQQDMMKQQQAYNEKNMAIQNQYAIEAFNRENAYNSPEEVSKRYKAAGISPLAAFGNGGVVGQSGSIEVPTSQSIGTPSSPDFQPLQFSPVEGAMRFKAMQQQVKSAAARERLDEVKARTETANAEAKEVENRFLQPLMELKIDNAKVDKDLKEFSLRFQQNTRELDIKKKEFEADKIYYDGLKSCEQWINQGIINNTQAEVIKTQLEQERSQTKLNIEKSVTEAVTRALASSGINLNKSKIKLNEQSGDKMRRDMSLVSKRIEEIAKNMDVSDQHIRLIKNTIAQNWARFGLSAAAFTRDTIFKIMASVNPVAALGKVGETPAMGSSIEQGFDPYSYLDNY